MTAGLPRAGAGRPRRQVRPATGPDADANDDGRAIIEVVFLAVLLLIPTIYILLAVLRLQSATLAVTQAARDVGRLIETSAPAPGPSDLRAIATVALEDQHLNADTLAVRSVPLGAECTDPAAASVPITAAAAYDVCVTLVVTLPGVPTALTGTANTVTGVYTIHRGGPPRGP